MRRLCHGQASVLHAASIKNTDQGQRHAHDNRGEDEIEGGDLQHVAVRVWVCVDVHVLSRHAQRFGTITLVSVLGKKDKQSSVGGAGRSRY